MTIRSFLEKIKKVFSDNETEQQDFPVVNISIKNDGSIRMDLKTDIGKIHPGVFLAVHVAGETYLRTANTLAPLPVQTLNAAAFELLKQHSLGNGLQNEPATGIISNLINPVIEPGREFR